ncbi:hypothetical protein LTR47_011727, partial [Exophiala xenobiotica]
MAAGSGKAFGVVCYTRAHLRLRKGPSEIVADLRFKVDRVDRADWLPLIRLLGNSANLVPMAKTLWRLAEQEIHWGVQPVD